MSCTPTTEVHAGWEQLPPLWLLDEPFPDDKRSMQYRWCKDWVNQVSVENEITSQPNKQGLQNMQGRFFDMLCNTAIRSTLFVGRRPRFETLVY